MYFVLRILRKGSDGKNSVEIFPYDNEDDAKHQFHQVMATYAYGINANYDYVSCEVRTSDGNTIAGPEVDNRIPAPEPEPQQET